MMTDSQGVPVRMRVILKNGKVIEGEVLDASSKLIKLVADGFEHRVSQDQWRSWELVPEPVATCEHGVPLEDHCEECLPMTDPGDIDPFEIAKAITDPGHWTGKA